MSTGRRLAKRSIIGTRVCAQGPDGLWYSGIIHDVKTPPNNNNNNNNSNNNNKLLQQSQQQSENNNCINLTSDTRYCVRFNFKTIYENQQQEQNNINESMDNSDIIMMDTTQSTNITTINNQQDQQQQLQQLQQQHQQQNHLQHQQQQQQCVNFLINPAQSLRHNAMIKEYRESELIGPGFRSIMGVQLLPGQKVFLTYNGRETSGDVINHDLLKDDVTVKIMAIGSEEPLELKKRLEEVRLLESRRSARLADQDRDTDFARLADMAGDRRRTSHSIDVPLALTPQHNSRKRRPSCSQDERDQFLPQFEKNEMEACNAALVLMSLSCSPRSPSAGQWNTGLGSSPGSSSASWSSGSSSPPLSDDGTQPPILVDANGMMARLRTTSVSTSDEGIVMDYSDDGPRKRKANGPIFKCTWKGCGVIELTVDKIEKHVRNAHLGPKKPRHSYEDDGTFSDSDHEEEFYYTEEDDTDEGKAPSPPSPPTLSHRDMARPPHEDPEYQRQIVGNFRQGLLALTQSPGLKSPHHHITATTTTSTTTLHNNNAGPINIPTSPLAHHNYTWAAQPPHSPVKHARWSPRPSTSSAPYPSPPYIHYNNNNNHQQHQIQHQQQHHHHHQQQQQQQHHANNYNNNNSNNIVGSNSSNIVANNHHHSHHHNNMAITNNRNHQHHHHNNHHLSTTGLSHSAPNSVTTSAALSLSPNIHHNHHHTTIIQSNGGNNNNNNNNNSNNNISQPPISNNVQTSIQQTTNGTSIITTGGGNCVNNITSPTPSLSSNQNPIKYYNTSSTTSNNINVNSGSVVGINNNNNNNRSPQSPNRRTRGENKKCRKVYGMDRKDQWCTQCKWKKACSRFGD